MAKRDVAPRPVSVGEAVSVWAIWYGLVSAPFIAMDLWHATGFLNPSASWYIVLLVIAEGTALPGQAAAPVLGILSLTGRTSSRYAARASAAALMVTAIGVIVGNTCYAATNSLSADAVANVLSGLAYLLAGIGLAVWSCGAYATLVSGWRLVGKLIVGCAALLGMSCVARLMTPGWGSMRATAWTSPISFAAQLAPLLIAILYGCAGWMLLASQQTVARRGCAIVCGICGSCLLVPLATLTSSWSFPGGLGDAVLHNAVQLTPAGLAVGLLLLFERRGWVLAQAQGSCPACGYLLCGLPAETYRCPECGAAFRGAESTPDAPASLPGTESG